MPSHELNNAAWQDELDANTGEEQPTYARRSPLSPKAAWATADPTEARLLAERQGQPLDLNATRCLGVRQKVIALLNSHEIDGHEKRAGLVNIEALGDNLDRLVAWQKNLHAEVLRRRENEQRRRDGLRGTLRPSQAA